MNQDRVEGNWKMLKGLLREKWGKLTNDDVDVIVGKKDELIGKLQAVYGMERERAEKAAKEFWAAHREGVERGEDGTRSRS